MIFATSFMYFPVLLATAIPADKGAFLAAVRNWISVNIGNSQGTSTFYIILLFFLIIFFTYFYTAIIFRSGRRS